MTKRREIIQAKIGEIIANTEVRWFETALKRESRLRARGDTRGADVWFSRIHTESSRVRPTKTRYDEEEYRIGILTKLGRWNKQEKRGNK